MNMFNDKGEITPLSLRDALMTLVKYASTLEENQTKYSAGLKPKLSEEKAAELFQRAVAKTEWLAPYPAPLFERLANPTVQAKGTTAKNATPESKLKLFYTVLSGV